MGPIDMLAEQVISLAWIRCVIEEGVTFVNKKTGEPEGREKVIYESFVKGLELFDMPAAKGSKEGIEKNILEVVGGFMLDDNAHIHQILCSQRFRGLINSKIQEIRGKQV